MKTDAWEWLKVEGEEKPIGSALVHNSAWCGEKVCLGRFNEWTKKWENDFGREIDPQPTHWRPLPLAPNIEERG